ncbi:uncharacterized protein CTRU02_212756 [Colletotrichum truncatum]|uniref:Uncharacterized protein n=1 Tax=Colletotrichum truncatum TaxID=5467 RepID=A0ACC3YIR0_COLTU|nr:uncharacterized protein CTRU02_05166 [Colletotrichum truncatum]KAF6794333.1 hypothetical protein CTRU02_05166 [Colletotrichum truncatum]
MPRPRRTRRTQAPAIAAVAAAAPEDKSSPAPASGSDIYSHSDREHSVIRKEHEEGTSTRLRRSTSLRQKQTLKETDRAVDKGNDVEKDTKGKAKEDQQKSESSVEAGRKTRATPVQQRRDTTGLDMDDDLFGLDTTLGDDDDDAAAAPPSAPRSDTSTFSVSNFRRRGRAPSISINKDDAPIRPSSRGISTPGISSVFNIGNFRRRRREPSILGTAQKERAQRPLEPSSGPESGDEDEEDFNPEAESTPINNRRRTRPPPAAETDSEAEAEPVPESQQVLAPDSQPEKEAAVASSTRSRKRKSLESHEETERPGKASRTEPEPELADDSDSSLSDLPSPALLTPTRGSNLPRPVTPNQDEIMAPPESSGSEDDDGVWPDIHTLAKQRRRRASPTTPTRDGNISDASSPPSLTHSPNFPATRNKSRQKKQQKKVTTADLTGLLPQRRHKKNRDPLDVDESDDEVDTSNLGQGDDELSYIDARTRSRRARTTPLNRSSANRPPSRGSKATASVAKSKATPGSNRPSTRTYSRRLSDKENQVEVEDEVEGENLAPAQDEAIDSQESSDPTRTADELKQAVRKFKEVDRWELEFEEVTEDSSPTRDAR